MNDHEFQERIERGEQASGEDAQAMKVVFNALRREPEFRLPANFADRVIYRMSVPARDSSSDIVWLWVGLAACVIAMGVAVWITDFKWSFGTWKFLTGYKGLIVFGILFVASLQWVDRRIIQKSI